MLVGHDDEDIGLLVHTEMYPSESVFLLIIECDQISNIWMLSETSRVVQHAARRPSEPAKMLAIAELLRRFFDEGSER